MVQRVLGLKRLPDVATVSRLLGRPRSAPVDRRLGRWAEGTAVGFNRGKKGQRSYYPLFCTIAQSGQVFDVHHRPGNVHDSNGAEEFIRACIEHLRQALPGIQIEVRMDGAFFSDALVTLLSEIGVEFTISVPFERFVELKGRIENRCVWHSLGGGKTIRAKAVILYHDGRGAQEGVFAELKSHGQLDYVPTQTLVGNQIFLLSAVLAHNLNRELQMNTRNPSRRTTTQRSPLWRFERLDTLRCKIIQWAGRFTRPQGRLTLTLSANNAPEPATATA